jgi:hypothetical protein
MVQASACTDAGSFPSRGFPIPREGRTNRRGALAFALRWLIRPPSRGRGSPREGGAVLLGHRGRGGSLRPPKRRLCISLRRGRHAVPASLALPLQESRSAGRARSSGGAVSLGNTPKSYFPVTLQPSEVPPPPSLPRWSDDWPLPARRQPLLPPPARHRRAGGGRRECVGRGASCQSSAPPTQGRWGRLQMAEGLPFPEISDPREVSGTKRGWV